LYDSHGKSRRLFRSHVLLARNCSPRYIDGKWGKAIAVEFEELLSAPGMGALIEFAPIFGGAMWLVLTLILWRGGFNDLVEQMTRPRWSGADRMRALTMLPLRALSLVLAAGLASLATTVGLGFNFAVLITLWTQIFGQG